LNIRSVVQGDLLFTPGEIKKATIRGVPHIAFTPNTITYAVPSDSDLAGKILRAKIGIIFHTTYTGGTLQTMKANYGVNVSQLGNVPSVFYSDASYRDVSGNVLFTKAESDQFDAILRMAEGSLLKSTKLLNLFATQTNDLSLAFRLKTFFNTYVREGETLANTKAIVAKFKKYYANEHGINSRLDEIHATILNIKLAHVKNYINKRKKLAKLYSKELKNASLKLPVEKANCRHVFHLYTVYHSKRDLIIKKLKEKNVQIKIYYPFPIHEMKAYSYMTKKKNLHLPITKKMSKGIFSLPLYPKLKYSDAYKFTKILKKILKDI